ncbi:MAG: hypothetical protein GY941_29310 [Planctomycetes bacterium]|nr:hypothetical protein [Planctomycetota bacterium]
MDKEKLDQKSNDADNVEKLESEERGKGLTNVCEEIEDESVSVDKKDQTPEHSCTEKRQAPPFEHNKAEVVTETNHRCIKVYEEVEAITVSGNKTAKVHGENENCERISDTHVETIPVTKHRGSSSSYRLSKQKRKFKIKKIEPAYRPSVKSRPISNHCWKSQQSNARTLYAKRHCDLYIHFKAFAKIQQHTEWGKHTPENLVEQGGVLLGHAYVDEDDIIYGVVEDVVAGRLARGTAAYLEVSHETWKDMFDHVDILNQKQDSRSHVLGWYHTHPGMLDVFMSGTDRNTQERLFGNEWQFALVLNPQRMIWRVYQGVRVRECMGRIINT